MNRKPWPIIIISILFFFIPVLNIVGTYFSLDVSVPFFSAYMDSLIFLPENRVPLLIMILPSFAAGIALYAIKKWSYPVFFTAMSVLTYEIFKNYSLGMDTPTTLLCVVMPMTINMGYCFYFLLPNVRAVYYNPRLRWWESKPRYVFSSNIKISIDGVMTEGRMSNISQGGILAILPKLMPIQSVTNLHMSLEGMEMVVLVRVAYCKEDHVSHGLQFIGMSKDKKKFMVKFIRKLEVEKCELTRPVLSWEKDLSCWLKTLVKTGKGIIPG